MELKKQSNKKVKVIVIASILVVLVCAAISLYFNINEKKNNEYAKLSYEATQKYLNITEESSDADILAALNDLNEAETKFSRDSFQFSQMNFYQANLYNRQKNTDMENTCLSDIIDNAKKDNYLLPIALYRLAVNMEDVQESAQALELYKRFWDNYSDSHPYSQIVLFSIFRINYVLSNKDEAKKYAEILNEKYPQTSLANFTSTLV